MERDLAWDGCRNVRELGGLPVVGGGTTAWGRVVRADNPARLTASGWASLRAHGVRTVLALRTVGTEDHEPDPALVPADVPVERVHLAGPGAWIGWPAAPGQGPVARIHPRVGGRAPLDAVEAAIATDVEVRLLAGGLSPSDLTAARARLME